MQPDDGRLVSNFVNQALYGNPVTIYGDGSQTRSLCYIDDLVDGLICLMEQDGIDGPVNLGNPDERTVKEIAEIIIRLTGSKSPLIYRTLPTDDPVRRRPDISVAQKMLRWQPKVPLEQGLSRVIDYFKGNAMR